MSDKRNSKGQFAPGNAGGPGRRPLPKEKEYLETMIGSCSLEDWAKIVEAAVVDAKEGNHQARTWLSNYLIGDRQTAAWEPQQRVTQAVIAMPNWDDEQQAKYEKYSKQIKQQYREQGFEN